MELYLIRHGQSANNALEALMASTLEYQEQRSPDPPLTDLGKQQAQAVAGYLSNGSNVDARAEGKIPTANGRNITHVYCSAMLRALQTAQPIGAALGLEPQVWVEIHEQGGLFTNRDANGKQGFAGKTRSEIQNEFPSYQLPDAISEDGWWHGLYEDYPEANGRAIKVAEQLRGSIRDRHRGEAVAMVSHGTFMDALLKALLRQLPTQEHFYYHYNTALTRIDFWPNGRLGMRFLNRIDHLAPELLSL